MPGARTARLTMRASCGVINPATRTAALTRHHGNPRGHHLLLPMQQHLAAHQGNTACDTILSRRRRRVHR